MFVKYQHLERLGTQETEGILEGKIYVFYKIDGTNGSVWYDQEADQVKAGSRNRELSLDNDNAGFYKWVLEQESFRKLFNLHPTLILYGEWLVPHSLKTYRDTAWREFYVFDIVDSENLDQHIEYETYSELLEDFGINYIPPLAIFNRPSTDQIHQCLEKSGQYLIKDGGGTGEGIVIKNYDYKNKYGRQTWAKIVTNEFKEAAHKVMGAPMINGTEMLEDKIVEEFLTESFILKEKAKLEVEDGWNSKMIPKLLGVVYYEFIREETWNWVKKYKNPSVNFQLLQRLVLLKTKKVIGL